MRHQRQSDKHKPDTTKKAKQTKEKRNNVKIIIQKTQKICVFSFLQKWIIR